jgi:hypothetical protein
MTDDVIDHVTRGLTLLADEAEPAPIDTHDVITRAIRTRSRRTTVAIAFGTAVVVGALAVALGVATREHKPPAVAPPTSTNGFPVPGTEMVEPATDAERAARANRLQADLVDAFGRVLSDDWEHSTFAFTCDLHGCWAEGDIKNDAGSVKLFVHVNGDFGLSACWAPNCAKQRLDDGSLAYVSDNEMDTIDGKRRIMGVGAMRADGTTSSITVEWPPDRPTKPLTEDQWLEFATAFTY